MTASSANDNKGESVAPDPTNEAITASRRLNTDKASVLIRWSISETSNVRRCPDELAMFVEEDV
jgi:hypothetical protein